MAFEAVMLYRRKSAAKPTATFQARFLADALERAAAEFARLQAQTIHQIIVRHGCEAHYDKDGQKIDRPVTYMWARIETPVIAEQPKIPARLRRGANGLLKPKWI